MTISRQAFLRITGLAFLGTVRAKSDRRPLPARAGRWSSTWPSAARSRIAPSASPPATRRTMCPPFQTASTKSAGSGRSLSSTPSRSRWTSTRRCAARLPCCSATTATIRRACASARRRPPGSGKTASSPWTGTAASDAATAWRPAPTVRAASTGWTRGRTSTIPIPTSRRAPRAWWKSAPSAASAWPWAARRRASRPARRRRWSSATWPIRTRAMRQLLAARQHMRRRPELGTGPDVFYHRLRIRHVHV